MLPITPVVYRERLSGALGQENRPELERHDSGQAHGQHLDQLSPRRLAFIGEENPFFGVLDRHREDPVVAIRGHEDRDRLDLA